MMNESCDTKRNAGKAGTGQGLKEIIGINEMRCKGRKCVRYYTVRLTEAMSGMVSLNPEDTQRIRIEHYEVFGTATTLRERAQTKHVF